MNIKELLQSEKSVAFVEYMHRVLGINFYSTIHSNLMGFTIDGDQIQFKNYYELWEVPSDELLAEFLPEIDSFKMLAQFWDKQVKSSLALGLKLTETVETKYFHVKFGGLTKCVVMPRPPALVSLLKCKSPPGGMSYEYTNGKVARKYYLYIEDHDDMAKVLALHKLQINPSDLEHLECYYTDDRDFKVNAIYLEPPSNIDCLKEKSTKTCQEAIDFILNHGKKIWYIGMTKSGKLSLYWTTTDDKDFIQNL